jgi:phospholipase/carboxylesterase
MGRAPEPLASVEVEPVGPARSAVVWLHGLGADGHDFEPIVPELGLDPSLGVRFVFPHAPRIPVTINGGMVMRAWYDITELDLKRRQDEEGLCRSVAHARRLVDREIERGVPAERVCLAGFSQGGAVALHAALAHPERLAGLVLLSTYLVAGERLEAERGPVNADLPIFQAHGLYDPMVPFTAGAAACDRLRAWGYEVDWNVYPMQHQVCTEEIQALGAWLGERLA